MPLTERSQGASFISKKHKVVGSLLVSAWPQPRRVVVLTSTVAPSSPTLSLEVSDQPGGIVPESTVLMRVPCLHFRT